MRKKFRFDMTHFSRKQEEEIAEPIREFYVEVLLLSTIVGVIVLVVA